MRISELSKQSGVPVATIKFYLRERLLPPGTPTARNQAEYHDGHVRQLGLIRALTNIGQLDLSSVRELLSVIDNDQVSLHGLYEAINRAIFAEVTTTADSARVARARVGVDGLVEQLGWQIPGHSLGRGTLVQVLAALQLLGHDPGVDFFTPYAAAAERLVRAELDLLHPEGTAADRAAVVARSILFGVALRALHRMAQEHYLTLRCDESSPAVTS